MQTCVLVGGQHAHEHFKFDEVPKRILVQSGSTCVSVYDCVNKDTAEFVYNDDVSPAILDGLIETVDFDPDI